MSNNWLIKLKNPMNQCQITIYDDGSVYSNEHECKIWDLTDSAVAEIKALLYEDLIIIKNFGYNSQDDDGYIARFWDSSTKKRNLEVKGWRGAEELKNIVFRMNNFKKLFITEEEMFTFTILFYSILPEENDDER